LGSCAVMMEACMAASSAPNASRRSGCKSLCDQSKRLQDDRIRFLECSCPQYGWRDDVVFKEIANQTRCSLASL
jgi:hypothetical protein